MKNLYFCIVAVDCKTIRTCFSVNTTRWVVNTTFVFDKRLKLNEQLVVVTKVGHQLQKKNEKTAWHDQVPANFCETRYLIVWYIFSYKHI